MNEAITKLAAECGEAGEQLRRELGRWKEEALVPRIFIRDDDAVEDTPELRRLISILEHYNAPLLLAVIPQPAQPNLAALLQNHPLITPAVHGFRHQNHAPFGERSRELGSRPADEVLAELREGHRILRNLFGDTVSNILVPPWNRIDAEVADRVDEAGFAAISTHGRDEPADAPARVNTHVDIVHWSGGRAGRSHAWVFDRMTENLATAREQGGAAIGLLTHHLAHDEQAWTVLEDAMAVLVSGGSQWVTADSLVGKEALQ